MAGKKKTVGTMTPRQLRALKKVRRLTRDAQKELEQLLKRHEAGKITRVELNTGLEELLYYLQEIGMHEFEL